jgi:hypothetical protein
MTFQREVDLSVVSIPTMYSEGPGFKCRPRGRISSLIVLMMEAARTSETLVNFYHTTRRYNP